MYFCKKNEPMAKNTLTYFLLALASAIWGVSFILTKQLFLTESALTPLILISFRLLLATCVFLPTLLLTKKMERMQKKDIKWFLLIAFAEPFLYSFCETSGVELVSGSLSAVVVATIPLFVPFGMAAVYKEKIQASTLIGIVLSVVGIGLMLVGGESLNGNIKGMLFLIGAVVVAVFYTLLLVKVVDHYRPATITVYQNLFGFLYYLPLMLLCDGKALPQLSYSPSMILMILVLGIFCSTLAYIFYNVGIRKLGASSACIFTNVIPVFSLIAALVIGQEQFFWTKMLGVAIVVTGVIIAQR